MVYLLGWVVWGCGPAGANGPPAGESTFFVRVKRMLSRNATHGTGSASSGGIAPKGRPLAAQDRAFCRAGARDGTAGPGGGAAAQGARPRWRSLLGRSPKPACRRPVCPAGRAGRTVPLGSCLSPGTSPLGGSAPVPLERSVPLDGACPPLDGAPPMVPVPWDVSLEGGACPLGACLSWKVLVPWTCRWKVPVPWTFVPWTLGVDGRLEEVPVPWTLRTLLEEGACPLGRPAPLEGAWTLGRGCLSLGQSSWKRVPVPWTWKVPVPLEGGACPLGACRPLGGRCLSPWSVPPLGACPVPLERALGHCSRARWNGRRLVGQIASSSDSPRANARTTRQRSSANARSAAFKRPLGAWARRQAPAASLFASIAVG